MATRRVFALGLSAILAICGSAVAVAFGQGAQVATDGDPYAVTPAGLRAELGNIGVKVRYLHPSGEPVPAVSGVARDGRAAVGFEFQLFPNSDEATAQYVGHLRAEDFGWPKKYRGFLFRHWVRGILGNVAYAEYQKSEFDTRSTVKRVHELQLAIQRVKRGLDDALFASFPKTDPYVHALSPTSE